MIGSENCEHIGGIIGEEVAFSTGVKSIIFRCLICGKILLQVGENGATK